MEHKTVRFEAAKSKREWFITPCFGVINERGYYGYPVYALAFGWLKWRCKVELGVKYAEGGWKIDG